MDGDTTFTCSTFLIQPKGLIISRVAASVHSSFVRLSFPLPKLVEYQLLWRKKCEM
jgi:hypothetical protein